jgi:hypothetical protein
MFQLSLALQTIIFVSMDIQQILQSIRVHQFDLVLRENCVFGCDDLQGVFPRVNGQGLFKARTSSLKT